MYAISYEGIEILSADGSTVLRRVTQAQGVEIKDGVIGGTGTIEGSGEVHRFTATIENDLVKNTQKQTQCFIVLNELSKDYNGLPIVASFIFNLSYSIHVLGKNPLGINIQSLAKSLQKSIALNRDSLFKDKTGVGYGNEKGVLGDLEKLSKFSIFLLGEQYTFL